VGNKPGRSFHVDFLLWISMKKYSVDIQLRERPMANSDHGREKSRSGNYGQNVSPNGDEVRDIEISRNKGEIWRKNGSETHLLFNSPFPFRSLNTNPIEFIVFISTRSPTKQTIKVNLRMLQSWASIFFLEFCSFSFLYNF